MEWWSLVLILLAAFTAGLIDAAVGGGGLVQVPALFGIFPREIPATLLGTNKLSSSFGTLLAASRYARKVNIDWRVTLPAVIGSFVLAFVGAWLARRLPKEVMRPLVVTLLLLVAAYTLRNKQFGRDHQPHDHGRWTVWLALLTGGSIGLYDGFFGPGTGTFLLFAFIRVFGFDFLHASASTKLVNLASNVASVILFGLTGNILWQLGLAMATANIAGAWLGSHIAIRYGNQLIRKLFIALVSVLIAKLLWDTLHTLT